MKVVLIADRQLIGRMNNGTTETLPVLRCTRDNVL